MVTPDFGNVIKQYRQAARDAYAELGGAIGVPLVNRNDHLKALRNMSVEDLDTLSEEYGANQVAEYLARLAGG